MPKTRRAKKRRLARALVHQQKTRYGSVAATERRAGAGVARRLAGVVDPWIAPLPPTTLQQRLLEEFAPLAQELIEQPESERVAQALTELQAEVNGIPSRAKCPHCGNRQKVRKDGTFGKHAYTATDTSTCIGTDTRWDAT